MRALEKASSIYCPCPNGSRISWSCIRPCLHCCRCFHRCHCILPFINYINYIMYIGRAAGVLNINPICGISHQFSFCSLRHPQNPLLDSSFAESTTQLLFFSFFLFPFVSFFILFFLDSFMFVHLLFVFVRSLLEMNQITLNSDSFDNHVQTCLFMLLVFDTNLAYIIYNHSFVIYYVCYVYHVFNLFFF